MSILITKFPISLNHAIFSSIYVFNSLRIIFSYRTSVVSDCCPVCLNFYSYCVTRPPRIRNWKNTRAAIIEKINATITLALNFIRTIPLFRHTILDVLKMCDIYLNKGMPIDLSKVFECESAKKVRAEKWYNKIWD